MRELLYLSERKLFDTFVDPGRLSGVRARGVDASLSFLGATAKRASVLATTHTSRRSRQAASAPPCGTPAQHTQNGFICDLTSLDTED